MDESVIMINYRDVQMEDIGSKSYFLIKIYLFFPYLDSTGTQNRKKLKKQLQECSVRNLKMSGQIDIRFRVL